MGRRWKRVSKRHWQFVSNTSKIAKWVQNLDESPWALCFLSAVSIILRLCFLKIKYFLFFTIPSALDNHILQSWGPNLRAESRTCEVLNLAVLQATPVGLLSCFFFFLSTLTCIPHFTAVTVLCIWGEKCWYLLIIENHYLILVGWGQIFSSSPFYSAVPHCALHISHHHGRT